jgi:hypothetical protein
MVVPFTSSPVPRKARLFGSSDLRSRVRLSSFSRVRDTNCDHVSVCLQETRERAVGPCVYPTQCPISMDRNSTLSKSASLRSAALAGCCLLLIACCVIKILQ